MVGGFPSVALCGMDIARLSASELLDHIFREIGEGRGGWLVTANLDFVRRYHVQPEHRPLYDAASLRVADGMPLVWAARLQGQPVPERLAGSSLVFDLSERAAAEGRTMYFLGGAGDAASLAKDELEARYPGLRVVGTSAPWVQSPPTEDEVQGIVAELRALGPDLLLVGLGSPKQEELIHALRPHFPATWMIGVGISFSFVAGAVSRAPVWMQKSGLEWVHRLLMEPGRLFRRYVIDDLPFAFVLFSDAVRRRLAGPPKPS